jgi:hypothetical protein
VIENSIDTMMKCIEFVSTIQNKLPENRGPVDDLLQGALGLLGDLGQTFGKRMKVPFSQAYVTSLLNIGLDHSREDLRELADWVNKVCLVAKIYTK